MAVQPQFGKQVIEIATDEEVMFYDPWKTEDIVANNNYNSPSPEGGQQMVDEAVRLLYELKKDDAKTPPSAGKK